MNQTRILLNRECCWCELIVKFMGGKSEIRCFSCYIGSLRAVR